VSVFKEQPFGLNIINSLLVATLTVALSLVLGIFTSYSLSRKEFLGRKTVLYSFLVISIFPQIAILSGLFELIRFFGLYNRWYGLSLCYLIFTLPFTIWTLSSFMREIPKGIEEAATMDGATPSKIILKVFVPIMAPSILATSLLAFVAAWNEFLFALTFTLSNHSRTVPVAIAFMGGSSEHELPWAQIMAASVIVTLPIILIVLFFQKKFVSGLTSGAIKG
jgi:trehalose/maltose transport system permease protein